MRMNNWFSPAPTPEWHLWQACLLLQACLRLSELSIIDQQTMHRCNNKGNSKKPDIHHDFCFLNQLWRDSISFGKKILTGRQSYSPVSFKWNDTAVIILETLVDVRHRSFPESGASIDWPETWSSAHRSLCCVSVLMCHCAEINPWWNTHEPENFWMIELENQ